MIDFLCFLTIKLSTEYLGRLSENWYLTSSPLRSSFAAMLVVAASVPIGREMIGNSNDSVAVAVIFAVGITTFFGSTDFSRRKTLEDNNRRPTERVSSRRTLRPAPGLRNHRSRLRRSKRCRYVR